MMFTLYPLASRIDAISRPDLNLSVTRVAVLRNPATTDGIGRNSIRLDVCDASSSRWRRDTNCRRTPLRGRGGRVCACCQTVRSRSRDSAASSPSPLWDEKRGTWSPHGVCPFRRRLTPAWPDSERCNRFVCLQRVRSVSPAITAPYIQNGFLVQCLTCSAASGSTVEDKRAHSFLGPRGRWVSQ